MKTGHGDPYVSFSIRGRSLWQGSQIRHWNTNFMHLESILAGCGRFRIGGYRAADIVCLLSGHALQHWLQYGVVQF